MIEGKRETHGTIGTVIFGMMFLAVLAGYYLLPIAFIFFAVWVVVKVLGGS